MKNRNPLLWILIMFMRCCTASTSVSSDFTIQPSLDISSNIGSDATKSIALTTPFLTTESSGVLFVTTENNVQSLTTVPSKISPSSNYQIATVDMDKGDGSTLSKSDSGETIQQTSTYKSLNTLPTTKLDSVITDSLTDIKTSSLSVNSFSTFSISSVNSLEIVSKSSDIEIKSRTNTESAQGTISLTTPYAQQDTVSKLLTYLHMSLSTSNVNLQNVKSTDGLNLSKVSSVYESNFQTSLVLTISTSLSKTAMPLASELYTNISNEGTTSSVTVFLSTDVSVFETENIHPSESNSVHIQSVISGSLSSQPKSSESGIFVESDTMTTFDSTTTASGNIEPTPTISVISGTRQPSDSKATFSQPVAPGSSFSGSSVPIVASSMSSFESFTQINPSPASMYSDALNTLSISSSVIDGVIDSNSASFQTLSTWSVSELTTGATLIASSTGIYGSTYYGKLNSGHSKETAFTNFNSSTVSSLLTQIIDTNRNIVNSQSSDKVSTDLNKISGTVISPSVTSSFFISTVLVSSLTRFSFESFQSDPLQEVTRTLKTVNTVNSLSVHELLSTISLTNLQISMSPSSSMHSSLASVPSNSLKDTVDTMSVLTNNVQVSLTQNITNYSTVQDITNTHSAVSSGSVAFSSDSFIRLTQSSGITTSSTIYNVGTSMSSFSQSGLLSTQHSSLLQREIYSTPSSTTLTVNNSSLSNIFSSDNFLPTYVINSTSLSSQIGLHTSSLTRELFVTTDTTKTFAMSSINDSESGVPSSTHDAAVSTSENLLLHSASINPSHTSIFQSLFSMTAEENTRVSSYFSIKSSKISTKTVETPPIESNTEVLQTLTISETTLTYSDISPSTTIQSIISNNLSTEPYSMMSDSTTFSITPVLEGISSSQSESKSNHLTERYTTLRYLSSISSDQVEITTSTKSDITRITSLKSLELSLSKRTDVSSSLASKSSLLSPSFDTLPAQTTYSVLPPTSLTPSLTIVSTDFSPSIPLISSALTSDKISSILSIPTENISFISASSVHSTNLEQTDKAVSSSMFVSPIVISSSTVLSSLSGFVSKYPDDKSTIISKTSETVSEYLETLHTDSSYYVRQTTDQSIDQSFGAGNTSLSLSTVTLTSSEISIDETLTSYVIKSSSPILNPSTYFNRVSTVDGQSNGSFFEISSLSQVSVFSNRSSVMNYTMYTTSEVTLVSTYVTEVLTLPVLVDSTTGSQLTPTILSDNLMSQVESTLVSNQPSISASSLEQSSNFSLLSTSTKSGTIYKTDFLISLSTSVDSHSLSTSLNHLPTTQSGTIDTSSATIRYESSLSPSFSHVSLYHESFTPSSIHRIENTSQFSSMNTLLYSSAAPSIHIDMTSYLTTLENLTSDVVSRSSLEIATQVRSSTVKTLVNESITSNLQSEFTISGLLSESSQIDTAITSTSEPAATSTQITSSQTLSSAMPNDSRTLSSYVTSFIPSFFQNKTLSSDMQIETSSSSNLITSVPLTSTFVSIFTLGSSTSLPDATTKVPITNSRPLLTSSNLLESSSAFSTQWSEKGLGSSSSSSSEINLFTLTPLLSAYSSAINTMPVYSFGSSLTKQSIDTENIHTSGITISAPRTLSAHTPTSTTIYSSVPFASSVSTSLSEFTSIPTLISTPISSLMINHASTSLSTSFSIPTPLTPSIPFSVPRSISTTMYTSTFPSASVSTTESFSASKSFSVFTSSSVYIPISESTSLSTSISVDGITPSSAFLQSSESTSLSTSISVDAITSSSAFLQSSESTSLSTPIQMSELMSSSAYIPISESTSLSTSISVDAITSSLAFLQSSESTSLSTSIQMSELMSSSAFIPISESTSLSTSISVNSSTSSSDSILISKSTLSSASIPFFVSSPVSSSESTPVFTLMSSAKSTFQFQSSYSTKMLSFTTSLDRSQAVLTTSSFTTIQTSTSTLSSQVSSPVSLMTSSSDMILTTRKISPLEPSSTIQTSSESMEVLPSTLTMFSMSSEVPTIHISDSSVTEIKSTPVYSNKTSISKTYSLSASSPLVISQINESTIFISTSAFSTASVSFNSFSVSLTSVTSSVPVVTSSLILTTTSQPPEQTTVNATNAKESNWARTVLKIQRYINISDPSFVRDLEGRLAEAFNEAFKRQKLIKEGKFEPLQKRRRKKRFTSVGDASVHIHDVSRVDDTTKVTAVYAVERTDKVLTAEEAVTALDVLDKQELAIILKQVVDVKAEPYTQAEKPSEPEDETSQLLLYGAIAGGVGGTIILIWIIVCIYCKCCRHKSTEEDAEPELTSIQPQSSKRKDSVVKPLTVTPKQKTLVPQGSKFSLRKGRTYEVNDGFVTDEKADEQTLLKSPRKKKLETPESPYNGSSSGTPVIPKKELVPPAVKKGRRNSKNSIGPTTDGFENEIMKFYSPRNDRSQMFQSSISEDSEDTKLQLKSERKKNKERMAEKYGPELEAKLKEREQPKTESNILGMPNTTVPSFIIESGSPVRGSIPLSRKPSDGNTSADENLEVARNRMHKLLDEAFSLISPRNSLTENDLSKQAATNQTKPPAEKSKGSKSSSHVVDVNKAMETLKGFTNPGYTSSYSEFLETWSPYRSSDQVALISMPHKPEPAVTRLGNKSDKRLMTSSIAANGSRRPAANLEISNIKSISEAPETGKYATTSPKPIVIRTKEDAPNSRLASAKSNRISNELQNNKNFSATALNSDIFIRGSSTSLNKPEPQVRQTNDSLEMQTLKRNRKNSIRSQREPEIDNRNREAIDVIKNIKPEEANDKLYKSLKDEIKGVGTAGTTEDDINKKPIRRRNRKSHSKPMTDIV